MSDRQRELQRQRALALEQVAWFDREIAKVAGQGQGKVPAQLAPPAVAPAAPLVTEQAADEIIARYSPSPHNTERDVKRGCYLYFALALGAVVLIALTVFFIYSRK